MKRDGVFHTWIDYPKFHELVASGEHFTAADYMSPTPDWAVFNPVRTCLTAALRPGSPHYHLLCLGERVSKTVEAAVCCLYLGSALC